MKDRDGRTLTEAKTLIDWLFGGQTQDMGFRFVVQSPDALRRKWQNILIRRREQSQPRIAPAKPSTVMPRNSKPL